MDVEVQILNIPDPTADDTKQYSFKDQAFAAHILCAKKNEEEVNKALGDTYNKKGRSLEQPVNFQKEGL